MWCYHFNSSGCVITFKELSKMWRLSTHFHILRLFHFRFCMKCSPCREYQVLFLSCAYHSAWSVVVVSPDVLWSGKVNSLWKLFSEIQLKFCFFSHNFLINNMYMEHGCTRTKVFCNCSQIYMLVKMDSTCSYLSTPCFSLLCSCTHIGVASYMGGYIPKTLR